MKTFNTTLIILLLVMIMAGSIFYAVKLNAIKQEATHLQSQLAKIDTVIVIDSVSVKKLSLTVDKIRLENSLLNDKYLKSLKQILAYNRFVVTLQDSIKKLSTQDTTAVDSSGQVGIRLFNIKKDPFVVEGFFLKQEPWLITFNVLSAKLDLELIAIENKLGIWETYITTTSSNISFSSIDARYEKFNKSTKRFILGTQAIMSKEDLGAALIVGYNKSAISIGYGTSGINIGAMYFFIK